MADQTFELYTGSATGTQIDAAAAKVAAMEETLSGTAATIPSSAAVKNYVDGKSVDTVSTLSGGVVYDISEANNGTTYANLAAALNNGNNIPASIRKGGISIKFIQSSDNKYVCYMLKTQTWSDTPSDWERINVGDEVSDIDTALGHERVQATLTNVSGGIRYEDGQIVSGDYSHCSPIAVRKGDAITLVLRCAASYAALAKTNADGTSFTPVARGTTPNDPGEYTYNCDEDGYISATYRADYTHTIKILRFQTLTAIGDRLSTLEQETEENYTNLVAELNTAMVDKRKTYIIVSIPSNSRTFSIEGLSVSKIDWGDGTEVVPSSTSDLSHTYAVGGTYIIAVSGLTTIPNGSQTPKSLYDRDQIIGLYIGSTVITINNLGIYLDKNLKEVHFLSETIPTLNGNAIQTVGNYPIDIIVPDNVFIRWVLNWKNVLYSPYTYSKILSESGSLIGNYLTVTVGNTGTFQSLNDAIAFLSQFYPTYRPALTDAQCLKAEIKILNGTTISEQVLVSGIDLSYISITSDNYTPPTVTDEILEDLADGTIVPGTTEGWGVVEVNCSSFGNITHDSRGFKPLFRAENNGHLPQIACIFKATNAGDTAVGYFCNKGSSGLVRSLCGFIGFGAGVISNNESSITIREGIAMDCSVWGCHARHNGEVSARSVVATGCATDASRSSEYGAAVADRVADMDVREAYLGGNVAIRCNNASTICARATNVVGGGVANGYLVEATYSGRINASEMTFAGIESDSFMFRVLNGGWIDAFNVADKTYNVAALNTIDGSNGIIWG